MILKSFAESINEIDSLIEELERTYKHFKLITIVPISSGYILYYDFKETEK